MLQSPLYKIINLKYLVSIRVLYILRIRKDFRRALRKTLYIFFLNYLSPTLANNIHNSTLAEHKQISIKLGSSAPGLFLSPNTEGTLPIQYKFTLKTNS